MITPAQQAALFYRRKTNRSAVLADDLAQPAWGSVSFSANPTNGQTVTLGGSLITFGTDVVIGDSLAVTLNALLDFLAGSSDPNITQALYDVELNVLQVFARTPGVATMTLTASDATVSHSTLQLQQNYQRPTLDNVTVTP